MIDQKVVKFFLLSLTFVAIFRSSDGLSCRHCDSFIHPEKPKNCKRGFTPDPCGCYQVCAKDLGEECGGPWKIAGACGPGLDCLKDPKDFNAKGICLPTHVVKEPESANFIKILIEKVKYCSPISPTEDPFTIVDQPIKPPGPPSVGGPPLKFPPRPPPLPSFPKPPPLPSFPRPPPPRYLDSDD